LMARPPLLCKEWNMFLFNIHPSKPCALGTLTRSPLHSTMHPLLVS